MADYISREAAVEAVRYYKVSGGTNFLYDEAYNDGIDTAISVLSSEIPAADVRPVVRGEWEIMSNPKYRRCSVCHDKVMFNMKNLPNFCDVCGADMRPEPPEESQNG